MLNCWQVKGVPAALTKAKAGQSSKMGKEKKTDKPDKAVSSVDVVLEFSVSRSGLLNLEKVRFSRSSCRLGPRHRLKTHLLHDRKSTHHEASASPLRPSCPSRSKLPPSSAAGSTETAASNPSRFFEDGFSLRQLCRSLSAWPLDACPSSCRSYPVQRPPIGWQQGTPPSLANRLVLALSILLFIPPRADPKAP